VYRFVNKVEFHTTLVYVISEKNPQTAWWQHHQAKMPMARTPAITVYSSLYSRYIYDLNGAATDFCGCFYEITYKIRGVI
jgi:hypothetical protein